MTEDEAEITPRWTTTPDEPRASSTSFQKTDIDVVFFASTFHA